MKFARSEIRWEINQLKTRIKLRSEYIRLDPNLFLHQYKIKLKTILIDEFCGVLHGQS